MAEDSPKTIETPFTAFNFKILLDVKGLSNSLCEGMFSECDGLEITMEPKTIREGGNNNQQIHLLGPVSYGQLTLKRGMSKTLHLWKWFDLVLQQGQAGLRADGVVILLSSDRATENLRFNLIRCLPVKLRAPLLNAKDGLLAIEEMQIVYERLEIKYP